MISIDYRLSPQHTMPAPLEDTVRAVQFVRSKANEWNLDPNRIAALGGSAGAHLEAWVALHDDRARPDSADPVERLSSRLTCFVALSGPRKNPVILENLLRAGAEVHIIGKDRGQTDLPEFRSRKGVPLRGNPRIRLDECARGMGGRQCRCGEENLLQLPFPLPAAKHRSRNDCQMAGERHGASRRYSGKFGRSGTGG